MIHLGQQLHCKHCRSYLCVLFWDACWRRSDVFSTSASDTVGRENAAVTHAQCYRKVAEQPACCRGAPRIAQHGHSDIFALHAALHSPGQSPECVVLGEAHQAFSLGSVGRAQRALGRLDKVLHLELVGCKDEAVPCPYVPRRSCGLCRIPSIGRGQNHCGGASPGAPGRSTRTILRSQDVLGHQRRVGRTHCPLALVGALGGTWR